LLPNSASFFGLPRRTYLSITKEHKVPLRP
jgi:hypothetical protein